MPEALWSDATTDKPPGNPEVWVDRLADQVEIERRSVMNVQEKSLGI